MSALAVTFTAEGRNSSKARRVAALTADGDGSPPPDVPASYYSDSKKEALCLEYVRHFREKFVALFPERRPLFLNPKNEWGVSKFVCGTVRPTLLPYNEVYQAEKLAHFVAHFLHYEPLEAPNAFPDVLPSPTQVLKWRTGDSFDFAVVLCSYLMGAGYDACGVQRPGLAGRRRRGPRRGSFARGRRRRCGGSRVAAASSQRRRGGGDDDADRGRVAATPRRRRGSDADRPLMRRGDAAAPARIGRAAAPARIGRAAAPARIVL